MISRPQLGEFQNSTAEGARRRAQQEKEAAGTTLNNSTTQHISVHNQTTQAEDIAQASKTNATKWRRRGFQVEPSYKIGDPSTGQENAESSKSTLGSRLISRPLEDFKDSKAEVDSILNSNPHDPGD